MPSLWCVVALVGCAAVFSPQQAVQAHPSATATATAGQNEMLKDGDDAEKPHLGSGVDSKGAPPPSDKKHEERQRRWEQDGKMDGNETSPFDLPDGAVARPLHNSTLWKGHHGWKWVQNVLDAAELDPNQKHPVGFICLVIAGLLGLLVCTAVVGPRYSSFPAPWNRGPDSGPYTWPPPPGDTPTPRYHVVGGVKGKLELALPDETTAVR